jgi:hypothetical protein
VADRLAVAGAERVALAGKAAEKSVDCDDLPSSIDRVVKGGDLPLSSGRVMVCHHRGAWSAGKTDGRD